MSKRFKDAVKKAVQTRLPGREIEWTNTKNNDGIIEESVCIKDDELEIVVFVEDAIRDFYSDKYIEKEVDKIVKTYNMALEERVEEFVNKYDRFNALKDKIIYSLVNAEQNSYLKETHPYKEYLDFLVVCRAIVRLTKSECVAVKISNSIIEKWGITKEELFDVAFENIKRRPILNFDTKEEHIQQILEKFKQEEKEKGNEYEVIPEEERSIKRMVVCTLKGLAFGAVVLLMPDKVAEVARQYNMQNVYILPSSTDEIILLDIKDMELEEMEDYLFQLNRNVFRINREINLMKNNKYLSDAVYYLNMENEEIVKVCELKKHEEETSEKQYKNTIKTKTT